MAPCSISRSCSRTAPASYPDRDAVVLGETRLTYAQVDAAANQVANLLVAKGIGRGDKVALTCPNLPYFPIVYYGILKAGAVVVPLNVLLKGARDRLPPRATPDAKAYFCFQGTPELPMGTDGARGLRGRRRLRALLPDHRRPAAPSPIEGADDASRRRWPASRRRSTPSLTDADRHRGHPLHQRHDRPAQGRGAVAQQHGVQRADLQPALRVASRPGRHPPADAAALPLVRLDRADERRLRDRRDAGAAAPLRRRSRRSR